MVPMFSPSDIVTIIGMLVFLFIYTVAILIQIINCRIKECSFNLLNVALALVLGFSASVASFFFLYWTFGRR